jgi:hypothetical protein
MIAQCLFCNFVKDDRKTKKLLPLFLFNSTIPHIENKSILFFHTGIYHGSRKNGLLPKAREAGRGPVIFRQAKCQTLKNA